MQQLVAVDPTGKKNSFQKSSRCVARPNLHRSLEYEEPDEQKPGTIRKLGGLPDAERRGNKSIDFLQ